MNKQHTRPIRRVLAVILSLALLLTFTPLSGAITLSAGAESNAYTFVRPDSVELQQNTEWTAMQFDMSELHLDMADGGRTANCIRLVLGQTNNIITVLTNTQDNSKTIRYGLSNSMSENYVLSQRMIAWTTANRPQTMYLYISPSAWEGASPGTYTGEIPYYLMWNYATNPKWSSHFGSGTIPVSVTIPEPGHPVTVTADPSEGGTVSGAGNYEEDAQVNLTATPNDGYFFKEWQVLSGGVTIENDSFTMPDHAVEVKAVFEAIIPPQYTYDSDTKKLHLISGDFDSWQMWQNAGVPTNDVLCVTAEEGVRFVGVSLTRRDKLCRQGDAYF